MTLPKPNMRGLIVVLCMFCLPTVAAGAQDPARVSWSSELSQSTDELWTALTKLAAGPTSSSSSADRMEPGISLPKKSSSLPGPASSKSSEGPTYLKGQSKYVVALLIGALVLIGGLGMFVIYRHFAGASNDETYGASMSPPCSVHVA